MRYDSTIDGQFLRRSALGPVLSASRRRAKLPMPGRGVGSMAARVTLQGFGALTSSPVGAGAGAGAAIGASEGASVGSAIPVIGTAIGALVGAIGGAIAGSLDKRDPEQANFDQAVALWQQNPDNIYAIGNKYLPLAGLFDLNLKNPHIPIYQRYGRMGEQKFVNDLTAQVYSAAQQGRITANDTPLSVMANVVQPWIDSWGYGPMQDPHADMINRLIVGMIMDYVLGRQRSWTARSGDFPFTNIPNFALAQTAQPQATASQTPSPVATQAPTVIQSATSSGPAIAPPIGTPISSTMDDTGNMINIPAGGIYAGKLLPPAIGWLVTYGGTTYHISGGQLIPVQASNNTSGIPFASPQVATSQAVVTTPPAVGTAISYVRDNTTGQMVAIPTGGTFAGLTSTNGWLVTYPSSSANPGTYASNNGVLTPYNSTSQAATSIPSGFTATTQTALLGGQAYPVYLDSSGTSYIWTGTQMVPYQQAANTGASTSSGASTTSVSSGGGGFFPTSTPDLSTQETTPQPFVASASAGIDTNTLLLIGAGVGLLALLGRRK